MIQLSLRTISICVALMLSKQSLAVISEVSVYHHPSTNKRVAFFGDLHFYSPVLDQSALWAQLLDTIDASAHKNMVRFIVENSFDEGNSFTRLQDDLRLRSITQSFSDLRRLLQQTFDVVECGLPSSTSLSTLIDELRKPSLHIAALEELSKHFEAEVSNSDAFFQRVHGEINDAIDARFSTAVRDRIYCTPVTSLSAEFGPARIVNLMVDVAFIITKEWCQQLGRTDNMECPDSFDFRALIDIIDAPENSITVHVAGTTHKAHVEHLITKLGFRLERIVQSDDVSTTLSTINQTLQEKSAIRRQEIQSRSSDEVVDVDAEITKYFFEEMGLIDPDMLRRLMVAPEAFSFIEQYL